MNKVIPTRSYNMCDRGGAVVLVGVIGGSGLYHLDNLTFVCVSETVFQSNF
jgi:purine nucleoside phosphorylase